MDDKVKIRCPGCKQMFRERMNRIREGVQFNCLHCNKLITLSRESEGFLHPSRVEDGEGYAYRRESARAAAAYKGVASAPSRTS